MDNGLKREDWDDICCCGNRGCAPGGAVDLRRVTDRLDELQSRGENGAAERHLLYWLEEARGVSDTVGELRLENELAGFYRKQGNGSAAAEHAERALALVKACGAEGTSLEGTTCINAATVYTAFDRAGEAMPLFGRARTVCESTLAPGDPRLGGLYNNMGLCAARLGRWEEARGLFESALAVMDGVENGEAEAAVTWLNLADLYHARAAGGDDDARVEAAGLTEKCVEEAWALLNTPALPRDGYYRYVCEKCAPVFGFYGYFDLERQLRERI